MLIKKQIKNLLLLVVLVGSCSFLQVQCNPTQAQSQARREQLRRPRQTISDIIEPEDDVDSPLDKLYHIRERIHSQEWFADDTEELLELLAEALKMHDKLADFTKQAFYFVYDEFEVLTKLIEDNLISNCSHDKLEYRAKWTSNFDDFPNLRKFVAEINKDYYEACRQKLVVDVAKQIVLLEPLANNLKQLRDLINKEITKVEPAECNLFERCHDRKSIIKAMLGYIEPRMVGTPSLLIFKDLRKYRNLFLKHLIDLQQETCLKVEAKLRESYEDFELFIRPNNELFDSTQREVIEWMQLTNICHQIGLLEHHELFNRHAIEKLDFNEIRDRLVTDSIDVMPPHMTRNTLELMSIFFAYGPNVFGPKALHANLIEDSSKLADQADFRNKCSYTDVKKFLDWKDLYANKYVNLGTYFEYFGDQLVQFCRYNLIRDVKLIVEGKIPVKSRDKLNELRRHIESAQVNAGRVYVELYRQVGEKYFVDGLASYLATKRIKVKATDKPYDKDIVQLETKVKGELYSDCDLLRQNINSRGLDFSQLIRLDRHDGQSSLFDQFTRDWMANWNICNNYFGKLFSYRDLYAAMSKNGSTVRCFTGGCFMR